MTTHVPVRARATPTGAGVHGGKQQRSAGSAAHLRDTVNTVSDDAVSSEPWETPVVDLPDRVTPRWCAQNLTTPAGDAVVRSHLEPRSEDRRYRATWERFWRMLSFDSRWRRMTTEMLRADREHAVRALDAGLTGQAARKVRTYVHAVDRALERIERESAGPLAWASAGYAEMPPRAREALELLALTVEGFLNGQRSREDLAGVLDVLDLNPAGRDVPPEARARADLDRYR